MELFSLRRGTLHFPHAHFWSLCNCPSIVTFIESPGSTIDKLFWLNFYLFNFILIHPFLCKLDYQIFTKVVFFGSPVYKNKVFKKNLIDYFWNYVNVEG